MKNLLIITIIFSLMVLGVFLFRINNLSDKISGIENYDKNYYIREYGGDLDSNLSIFPDETSNMKDATFSSNLKTNLFDTDGYILLSTKYSSEDFFNEINRFKGLSMDIYSSCGEKIESYTNYIVYDEESYDYPAYITIDGFSSTYEYALINEEEFEIIYLYISYPKTSDYVYYHKYLKKDLSFYLQTDTLNMYSMYNHSFDGGKTFMEYGDCNQ